MVLIIPKINTKAPAKLVYNRKYWKVFTVFTGKKLNMGVSGGRRAGKTVKNKPNGKKSRLPRRVNLYCNEMFIINSISAIITILERISNHIAGTGPVIPVFFTIVYRW